MTSQEILLELGHRYPVLLPVLGDIGTLFDELCATYRRGGKLLVAGNGGSAADAEHIVGELMKGFLLPRPLDAALCEKLIAADPVRGEALAKGLQGTLPAISLCGEHALSTAVANDGEPYMAFAQQVLGYGNPRDALNRHVEAEDKNTVAFHDGTSGNPNQTIINESGLYSLILTSKLPNAREFKRWVTSEVLPSIRRNGGYLSGQEEMSDSEIMAKALMVAQRTIESKAAQIAQMRPKALFADSVAASGTSILIGELAKILRQNGVDMGEKRLFEWMRSNGYLVRRKGTDYNMPTQRAMELGLFQIKETVISRSNGHTTVSKTPKVTGKGQQYFINKFLA